MHLSDPVVTVQNLYEHTNAAMSWEQDIAKRFGFESDKNRLNVLLSQLQGLLFAVTKGN
jgi:LAS superfamily LD-carboxypeptidase LdcB